MELLHSKNDLRSGSCSFLSSHWIAPPLARSSSSLLCAMTPDAANKSPSAPSSPSLTEFVILGSGVSTGIPRISCIIRPDQGRFCSVCHDALHTPQSKNRRCNVSALVRSCGKTVLIDCGKTIREASMRHFPALNVRNIDAIVLTHGHADAVFGLDDTRDIQLGPKRSELPDGSISWIPSPTPVFLNEETMDVCRRVFPYLMPPDPSKTDIERRVSSLDWRMYGENEYFIPFRPIPQVPIEMTPIPMYHGGEYICMGFVISVREREGGKETVIAYLSDTNEVPKNSLDYLRALNTIDLVVVDVLTNSNYNTAHFSKQQAIDFVKQIQPKQAVAVGMTCSLGLHDQVNASLASLEKEGVSFRLAFDGERFPCAK